MTRTTQITATAGALALFAAIALAFSPAALAGEKANKDAAATTAPHDGIMTEKLGKEVPTMTSDKKAAAESDAPDAQTYTDRVGEAVPTMTAPDGETKSKDDQKKTKVE